MANGQTIGQRIRFERKRQGLSMEALGQKMGISGSLVGRYERDEENPKIETVMRFARALNVLVQDLYPEGMYADDVQAYIKSKMTPNPQSSLPAEAIPVRPGPMIPVLGQVRCGLPMYAEENIVGYESFAGKSGEQYFALYAVGDSMNAAGINDGDVVIVQRQDVVEPNQIAVVCVNGDEATLKRFRQEDNLVFLSPQSYNPAHQIQVYDLKKTPVHIMGRVVQVRHNFQ